MAWYAVPFKTESNNFIVPVLFDSDNYSLPLGTVATQNFPYADVIEVTQYINNIFTLPPQFPIPANAIFSNREVTPPEFKRLVVMMGGKLTIINDVSTGQIVTDTIAVAGPTQYVQFPATYTIPSNTEVTITGNSGQRPGNYGFPTYGCSYAIGLSDNENNKYYKLYRLTLSFSTYPRDYISDDGILNFNNYPITSGKPYVITTITITARHLTDNIQVTISRSNGYSSSTITARTKTWSNITLKKMISQNDPYIGSDYAPSTAPGGLSDGTFDFTDNGLTYVNTPGIDLLGSGFLTAWNVNKAQLNALANWLWVTTPGQILQQIYGNPINAVIGLNVVPVAPSIDGGANTIKFGPEDSGVAAPKITSQYVSVDCGTLTIAPVYGSYMDYGPYSSAELFLPYCGGVPLDINDVIGKTISVKYQVDILSGACVAYIFIDGHLHYQKSGCCAGTAPVTGSQMPNVISGVLSIVGSVAGAIGSLGASGASTAAKVASGIATGTNVADAATNALKRSISYSGTVSGWAGLLGAQKPYLILTLPNAAIPEGQQQLSGYPAWVGGQLSGFSGHTECANVHLNGLRATDEEMLEIRALLESGVIL